MQSPKALELRSVLGSLTLDLFLDLEKAVERIRRDLPEQVMMQLGERPFSRPARSWCGLSRRLAARWSLAAARAKTVGASFSQNVIRWEAARAPNRVAPYLAVVSRRLRKIGQRVRTVVERANAGR